MGRSKHSGDKRQPEQPMGTFLGWGIKLGPAGKKIKETPARRECEAMGKTWKNGKCV